MTYPRKLYLIAQIKLWGILFAMVVFLYLDLRYFFSNTSFTLKTVELLLATFIGYIFYPIHSAFQKRVDEIQEKILIEAGSAKLGFKGEDKVAEWLEESLPTDKYSILRNVTLPEHKFDIDFVIIGPQGVIVLEVKNFSDQRTFIEDEYYQVKDGQRYVLSVDFDPRFQVQLHVYYLRKYLEDNGLRDVRILKAIVFPKSDAANVIGSVGVYIASGLDALKRFFDGATFDPRYTSELRSRIKAVLSK
ncbi:MAG: nuclease-related domain-containing protein [bacterium]|nr:nuclease-related domain-containing protein [bacterium]